MTHASLFTGIGGFDYWPNITGYEDINKTDFAIWRGRVDVLTGGFPCQPFSVAGGREGTNDDRYLWPQMLRAIREIAPRWVVAENVPGILSIERGVVFEQVCADLEAAGYEVQPVIVPACGKNAPHRRERVWFIAYATSNRRRREGTGSADKERREQEPRITGQLPWRPERLCNERFIANPDCFGYEKWDNNRGQQDKQEIRGRLDNTTERSCNERDVANANGIIGRTERYIRCRRKRKSWNKLIRSTKRDVANAEKFGLQRSEQTDRSKRTKCNDKFFNGCDGERTWANWPTQPPVCSGDDGLQGRLDGITFPKWRAESIKAYGNAVVPQVVVEIFKAIEKIDLIIN